jgi:hypothetical protein
MDTLSFNYNGKEYLIDKLTELQSQAGQEYIRIVTKDNRHFNLTFKESLYRWVVSESVD